MKICITSESYLPSVSGVAVFTQSLANYLSSKGHRVILIVPSTDRNYKVDKADNITVYRLRSLKNPFRKGHRFTVDPFIAVRRIIKFENPDILHLQDPSGISLSALLTGRKLHIPIIATNHFMLDYVLAYLYWLKPLHPLISWILSKFLKWFYNQTNYVTCPTNFVSPYIKKLGVRVPIKPLSNGINLEQFYAHYGNLAGRLKYDISTQHPVVLYVGRLDIDKSPTVLIDAIMLARKHSKFHAILCGEGKLKNELIKKVKAQKADGYIKFIGPVDRQDLPIIYQMANVFVTASTTETQSLTALEAMASGIPVITPRGTAINEILKDGVTGYRCLPYNPQSIANNIVKIIKDPKKSRQMGQNGLQLVANHESSKALGEFIKLYETTLKTKKI